MMAHPHPDQAPEPTRRYLPDRTVHEWREARYVIELGEPT